MMSQLLEQQAWLLGSWRLKRRGGPWQDAAAPEAATAVEYASGSDTAYNLQHAAVF